MLVRPKKRVVFVGNKPLTDYESYSSMTTFKKCPVLFYEMYFRHVSEPGSPQMTFGTAVHGAIQDALVEKRLGGSFSIDWLVERFQIRWTMELEVAKRSKQGIVFEDRTPGSYTTMGAALLKIWFKERFPSIEPRQIEWPFELVLSGIKRSLYGRVDLVMEPGIVVDHKTSSRPFKLMEQDVRKQFGVYFAAYAQAYEDWPRGQVHLLSTGAKLGTRAIPLDLTEADVQRNLDEFVRPTMKAIDDAWEAQEFKCTCKEHQDQKVREDDIIGGVKGPPNDGKYEVDKDGLIKAADRSIEEILKERNAQRLAAAADKPCKCKPGYYHERSCVNFIPF